MSTLHVQANELKEANAELHQARLKYFDKPSKHTYLEYYRCMVKVNTLEEELGCKIEDVHQVLTMNGYIQ